MIFPVMQQSNPTGNDTSMDLRLLPRAPRTLNMRSGSAGTRAAGTGLGLAIAKKVVEDHGGTVELESEPGDGTRVSLRFPV